jgi:endo-1,4-beta-xylanase
VAAQCDSLTPELDLKWARIEPADGAFDFARMDALADFARRHRKQVHGHTLLWHRSIPDWAAAALAQTRSWEPVQRYFAAVMRRYGDLVGQWDVVNEPIEVIDGQSLRQSPFHQAFGPGYIRRALESARGIAPEATLLINDYGLEYPHARDEDRRRSILGLVDSLRRQGAPLDGLGIQAHLDLRKGPIDQRVFEAFLQALADRGLMVFITELDVREADRGLPIARRDHEAAQAARALLDVAFDQPAVRGVTTWGLSDRYSWLNADEGNRGLPLDGELQAKPLYDAIADAMRRPPRHAAPLKNRKRQ